MSGPSIASSPTLLDHPDRFDDESDLNTPHRAGFHFQDRYDFSTRPAPLLPPPYPESVLFSEEDEEEYHYQHSPRPRIGAGLLQTLDARASLPRNANMKKPGLQLLYTHIAHGAIHDAVVEQFNPPSCHPETHRAIVDDVMSWIQYIPPPTAYIYTETASSPTFADPAHSSATLSFYGPHAKQNRARSTNKATQPAHPEHILWLMGPTSCGKSSLMRTISERCLNTHVPSDTPGGPPMPLLAASFFFRHYRAPRNDKSRFITTIVYQLTKNVPGLGEIVEKVIERDVGILSLAEDELGSSASGTGRTSGLVMQMEKLLLEPLAQLAQLQQSWNAMRNDSSSTSKPATRVILIEALDECINDEDQLDVLNVIRRLSQDRRFTTYFRLVISSKPHRTIERQFKLHPEMDLATYRLNLPFPAESALERSNKSEGGRRRFRGPGGSSRAHELGENVEKDLKRERDIRLYLECKFNEICRNWYGLPRNVGWPHSLFEDDDDVTSIRSSRRGGSIIDRLVYNTAGMFPYALTVARFVMQGDPRSDLSQAPAESKDSPKRLLELVLKAKFEKSYKNPLAALDALYGVIINEAAQRAGFQDVSQLARVVRQVDELLSTGHGLELTLPRFALFFGFGAAVKNPDDEAKCIEKAFVGGLLNSVLEVPVPIEEGESAFAIFRKSRMRETTLVRRVVKFHDREFVEFLRDPKRCKGLYVSRSQLYTDLAVRYLKSASAQHSLQPTGFTDANINASRLTAKNSGRIIVGKQTQDSPSSSTSSFSATFNATDDHATGPQPFSPYANRASYRRNHPYPLHSQPQSPYAIDADDASLFFSQLHLGKFCSFAAPDNPVLVKELLNFDVDLWLFGIAAAAELTFGASSPPPTSSQSPLVLSLGARGHRRVRSEAPTRSNVNMLGELSPEDERERERKRTEALMKLHSNTAPSLGTPENDIDAMYRWVHVECSWSHCTPICKRWRRPIVKFWQKQGAPQQPSVMDRIYDKFISRDVKRVKLITTRYRL